MLKLNDAAIPSREIYGDPGEIAAIEGTVDGGSRVLLRGSGVEFRVRKMPSLIYQDVVLARRQAADQ